jgi:hypothetical protein
MVGGRQERTREPPQEDKMKEEYREGDEIRLVTQSRQASDGTWYTVFYTSWDSQLAGEGFETVTLSAEEAEALNRDGGRGFTRP